MRNLMKFGMVLVVLAMVTSVGFASNDFEGDSGSSWCDEDNWDNGDVPSCGDGQTVRLDDDAFAIIDCSPASAKTVEINGDAILQVGTATVHVSLLQICGDLEMSDDRSSDDTTLDIVNGNVLVRSESEKLAEDGNITINVAAGSGLYIPDGVEMGESSDGSDSVHVFNIAGVCDIATDYDDGDIEDDASNRFEHYRGQLIINLTGDGIFTVEKTTRISSDDDSVATINITDDAAFITDKIEVGKDGDGDGIDTFDYSVAINVSGNGSWIDTDEIKDEKDGQVFNVTVTGNGSVHLDDFNIKDRDSETNITMDGGTFDVDDDIEMNAGKIVITGGAFNVEDDLKLGNRGVATMTVSGTAEVWIDDLYLDGDSELTIDGVRMDIDDLKKDDGSIEINGAGSLVIKNADDQDDLDDINDLIDDDDITTSNPGMVIVADYGITHDGKLTIQPAIPVDVDIKPGSSSNPLRVNFGGSGRMPVAILGTDDLDVTTIDADTVTLAGVAVNKAKVGDVNGDGKPDLALKFDRTEILDALEAAHGDLGELPNREELTLILFAESTEGLVSGTDTLVILNRGRINRSRR